MMKSNVKKIAAVLCVGAMALTSTPVALAAEIPAKCQQESEIAPYFLYILEASSGLSISNRVATVTGSVEGYYSSATQARVELELQVKSGSSWSTIASWNETQKGYRVSMRETKSVTAGKTYRVKATVTVWEGSQSETRTVYSGEETA